MAQLRLTCLGACEIVLAGEPLTAFSTDKVRALLVYLVLEQRAHERSQLAQFLWPGYGEESARQSLRQALYRLRQLLPDSAATAWVLNTRQTVQFDPAAPVQVDVITFTQLLADCTSHAHDQLITCQPCLARLRQAVDLHRGDFLAGFTVADSDPFEEWRRVTQEQLHIQMLDALTVLANAEEAAGEEERALQHAQRQLALEPWLEAAHRQIMRILARRGQRAAAIAQYNRCRQVLAEELHATPDEATLTLYQQIQSGAWEKAPRGQDNKKTEREEDRETSDKATSDKVTESPSHGVPLGPILSPAHPVPPTHNLPAALTPMIGRNRELAEITTRLQPDGVRLLTLVGPGGMGKTRLALAVGHQQLTAYPDGVWFVSLAALTSPAAIGPAIANALGVIMPRGEPGVALGQLLQPKRLLLILDNFEHLLAGASEGAMLVTTILQSAPAVQILVTSRERLHLRGEQVYSVPPLTFTANATLAEADNAAATRVFVQYARLNQANFQLSAANLTAVLRICQLVQEMPLGLELAAAHVGTLPLNVITDEIAASAEFLTVDWPDLPERQRSMRAVFAWSWRLLDETEQRALRQVAIFRGGFTREAAQAIANVALATLTRLVHRSLLHWEERAAEGRYAIHELLRQFAAEQLAQMPTEQAEVAAQHSAFYLNYLAAREARLTRAEPRTAAAEIQMDLDNIRQAWQGAVQRQDFPALQRNAWALSSFYRHKGLLAEARQTFQALADQVTLHTPPADGTRQQQPHTPPSRLVAIYAYLVVLQGKLDHGTVVAQQALALAQVEDAIDAAALSHFSWGQALRVQGCLAEAQPHLEQALHFVRSVAASTKSELINDVECLAEVWLGGLTADLGNYQQARERMERSLHLAQTLGKRRMEMVALTNMADIARRMGAYPSARQEYEDALRLAREVGFPWGEGVSQLELGDVVRLQGEYSYAALLMEGTLTIFQEIGEHEKKAIALTWLGQLFAYLGDSITAEAWLTRYQQFAGEVQGWEPAIEHLQARMVLALQRGEPAQALRYATESWQIGQTHDMPDMQAYALIGMGHAQRQLGQLAAAATAYQQAFDLYTTIQRPDLAVEGLAALAALAQQQGNLPRALGMVETVLAQLAAQPISGQDEPFFLYLTCYQVLAAAQDPRAPTILQQGYHLLQRYAEAITTDELRQSFLENVPVHHALQQAYTALQASASAATLRRRDGQA